MTLDRTWLLGVARAEREALGRTIQYTEPGAWEAQSVSPGWRNRDVIAHLAAQEATAAALMAGETPSELEEYAKSLDGSRLTVDGFNQYAVARRADEPFRAVVREWGQAADQFLARSAKLTPEEWTTRKVAWLAGEIGVSYLIQSRVVEWWFHGEDIRAGADNPPRLEHPPVFCVNDLAVRMIPYSLALAGLTYPGKSVLVKLSAVGGGEWNWGLAPRENPPAGKEPDALIEGRGYEFALAAGRRVPADYFLAEGSLLTGGDDQVAEAILTNLRAFAV
jgi:uncharacterized protein (TIGR03083 family)